MATYGFQNGLYQAVHRGVYEFMAQMMRTAELEQKAFWSQGVLAEQARCGYQPRIAYPPSTRS